MTYSEKLRDPRWQKKRLEALENANFSCQECGSKTEELHVHHRHYKKNLSPWEYEAIDLQALCKTCHTEKERLLSELKVQMGRFSNEELQATLNIFDNYRIGPWSLKIIERFLCSIYQDFKLLHDLDIEEVEK